MYYLYHLKTIGPDFFLNLDKNNWSGIFTDYKFFRPDTETGFENKAIEQDKKKVFTKWVEQENSQQSISVEPLITIYEPAMFSHFMNAYETKRKSVLRVLQQVEIEIVQAFDPTLLQNINTFDEYQQVKQHVITPRH